LDRARSSEESIQDLVSAERLRVSTTSIRQPPLRVRTALEDFTVTPDSTVILDSTAEELPDSVEAADFMEVVDSTVVAAIVDFGGTPKALSSESAFCLGERVTHPSFLCLGGDFFLQIGSC
jgi:hypothetical protein